MSYENLIQLDFLKGQIILEELIGKTQSCGLTWASLPHGIYHTRFLWQGQTHDVYVSPLQNSYSLDLVKNGRTLAISPTINIGVDILYKEIADYFDANPVLEMLVDLNQLPSTNCSPIGSYGEVDIITGGIVVGGTSIVASKHAEFMGRWITSESKPEVSSLMYAAVPTVAQQIYTDGSMRNVMSRMSIVDIDYDGQLFWAESEGIYGFANQEVPILSQSGIACMCLDKFYKTIYYAIQYDGYYSICVCNYDGGTNVNLVPKIEGQVTSISAGSNLYWTDNSEKTGRVIKAELDGKKADMLFEMNLHIKTVLVYGGSLLVGGSGFLLRTDFEGQNEFYVPMKGLSIINDMDGIPSQNILYVADVGTARIGKIDFAQKQLVYVTYDSIRRTKICLT